MKRIIEFGISAVLLGILCMGCVSDNYSIYRRMHMHLDKGRYGLISGDNVTVDVVSIKARTGINQTAPELFNGTIKFDNNNTIKCEEIGTYHIIK